MALMHRIVDTMVDHYRPEVDKLEERIDELEATVFDAGETRATNQEILDLKRDVASLRRIILPQRDVLVRLGRREFPQISEEIAYRFRDVYDHVVRISDDALLYHDRLAAILGRAPVERVEPPQRGDEVPHDLLGHLHAHDGPDRDVRDERAPRAFPRAASASSSGGSSASWRPCPACCSGSSGAAAGSERPWGRSASSRPNSRTRSPPARWSSARPPSSRNWSRTPSTRARRGSPSSSRWAARS